MKCVAFTPELHEEILADWFRLRDITILDTGDLPSIGYVSFDGTTPIAMAFLRRCEGGYALLDGLASNPTAPSFLRHIGIDMAVSEVIRTAGELRIKKLLAYSIDESTLKRSESHGFSKLPYTMIGLNLGVSHGISGKNFRHAE